jgi:sporulation protein YlmC with PRC-barrel domain
LIVVALDMEEDMLKIRLAAGLAATALMTGAAMAQTSTTTTPTPPAQGSTAQASGQLLTQMSPDMMRGSKLMGVDVYGSDNQKIGDIDEVLVDKQGKIQAVVVGVGGFLGIGEKDIAVRYEQVQWMSPQEVQAASPSQTSGTTTTGGVTAPGAPAGGGTNPPATTGSTGAARPAGGSDMASSDNTPARAMVKMTKADLQNAAEFRYSANAQ